MKQSKDVITFEVDETLTFESGQEIAEMISISLEPDISTQTYENYIQVQGEIVLQGEYIKVVESSLMYDSSMNTSANFVEKVVDTAENQAKFTHRFPLEISIPPYRVEKLEDITVTIDSFDYELPGEEKLKIKSSVHINGVKQDIAIEDKLYVDDDKEKAEKVEKVMTEEITDVAFVEREGAQERETVQEVAETDHQELLGSRNNEIDIQVNENEAEEEEDAKDVRFLTDLFGNQEEETFTKMRIYIAQEEDTIETIAKRYGVSALQLLKDNNLSGDSIGEGQLLQLPVETE